ncbi:MAG TPA: hypothetical protein PK198_19750 [Saprospiraceae bacterium]|nr:hypothetical protein [Saprospiraceae bacterium]
MQRLKELLGGKIRIKASGGIRTAEDAARLVEAGAARIGITEVLI